MKVLLNKLKKANKVFLIIFLLTFAIFTFNYILLVKNLLSLTGIETIIRSIVIVIFGVWLIVYLIWNLINLILKKHVAIAITTAITVIFIVIFSFANHYIGMLNEGMDNLTESEYVTYTSNLVVLNGTNINKDSKLGMINSSDDIEGNELAKELIKEEKLTDIKIVSFASYYEMIYALLNKEVDGVFLNTNYLTIFSDEEFEGLKNTTIAYSFSKKMKNKDTSIVSNKKLTEPFSILLMGVDSEANGLDANASFNGDTLMLVTFNPKTLNATMFSIPRDMYVPIACNHDRYAKINSSAAYGTNCVINTVQQFTGIDIDYYVKINFKGVVDLVEALGGIDVDVEVPDYSVYYKAHNGRVCEQNSLRQFGDNLICIDTGMQHLNGEQALAYARCRHAYLQSDIARNRHQQQIVEAIARKLASPSNINKLEELLNAVTNNLATNMAQKQMLSFYDVMKNMISKSFQEGDFISIQKTYLEYYSLPVKLNNNGAFLSALGHYQGSLDEIVKAMKVNLELEKKEIVKSFSFDANEVYTTKVTGQGIVTGDKLETVPNFIGKSITEAETWAINHDITLTKEFVDIGDPNFNPNVIPGLISNQSVSNGILTNTVSEIVIYINNASNNPNDDNNSDGDNDNSDNSDNSDDNSNDLPDVILPSEGDDDIDNNKDDNDEENDKTSQD